MDLTIIGENLPLPGLVRSTASATPEITVTTPPPQPPTDSRSPVYSRSPSPRMTVSVFSSGIDPDLEQLLEEEPGLLEVNGGGNINNNGNKSKSFQNLDHLLVSPSVTDNNIPAWCSLPSVVSEINVVESLKPTYPAVGSRYTSLGALSFSKIPSPYFGCGVFRHRASNKSPPDIA